MRFLPLATSLLVSLGLATQLGRVARAQDAPPAPTVTVTVKAPPPPPPPPPKPAPTVTVKVDVEPPPPLPPPPPPPEPVVVVQQPSYTPPPNIGPGPSNYTPPNAPPLVVVDGVRVRGGLMANAGMLFYTDTGNVGGGGGISARLGVQFNHIFSLYYQNMLWIGGLEVSSNAQGYMFDYNTVLAGFTFGHVFEIAVGPSIDWIYGFDCAIVNSAASCGGSSNWAPAAHGRIAIHLGSLHGSGPRRSGFSIGIDVHPFFPEGQVTLVNVMGGAGIEWY